MKTILLSLYISLRFFKHSKKNKIISFISITSIISSSLGIAILIVCLSAINGFNRELNEHILSIIPHGNIELKYSKFYNISKILNQIKTIPGVTQASPYINFSGLIERKNKFYPIQIYGINTLYDIHPKIFIYLSSNDTLKYFSQNKQIIILGKGAANNLQIKKNNWIDILIHNPNRSNNFLPYKTIHTKIIDVLDLKSYLDHHLALIPLSDAQNYTEQTNNISGINIKVNNIFHISKILNKVKKLMNNNVIIHSWIDTYKYIYQDIQIIKIITSLTMTLVITIAAFSIISILTLTIKEKNKDIAILYTLGSTNHLIYTIFIWYGLLKSIISILIGGTIGILTSIYLTKIYNILENIFKYKILDNDSYFINFLPTQLHIKDIIIIFIIELILSFLATLYPAIHTNKIHPANILK